MTTNPAAGEVPAITCSTPIADLPQFLTVEEWRSIVRLSRSAAYAAIRAGHVRVQRFGRTIRIPREVLQSSARVGYQLRPHDERGTN
jgi:excisionase family DNA binding protein